ncbi:uncharacterized protein PAC_04123 [Phialocephala subalpina]|uniref:Uncharacterized protein n=1 Tax=Phialocephala subalpina TaxID=576137 RepID=A0A1L7WN87_9HELO|nr:uncharacterized protein PAC_04123 [Phialocephala subalpina]
MLTLYKAPRSERSSSSSGDESGGSRMTIPAGRPYITKVNGKLVMAREKREKNADVALDLLGEVFGPNPRTRIIRKRSKSITETKGPLLINGIPYVPQLPPPVPPNTAPIPQQGFIAIPPPVIPPQYSLPYPPQLPPLYPPQYPLPHHAVQGQRFLVQPPPPPPPTQTQVQPKPTKQDLEQLVEMDSHFSKEHEKNKKSTSSVSVQDGSEKVVESKTAVTIVKHICAHCGNLRSRKYHHEHPIKPGEIPAPDFCRKCQRDASSRSESSDSDREDRRKEKKGKKKTKVHSKKQNKKVVVSSSEDESPKKENKQSRKPTSGPAKKKEGVPFDPKEDYIVVEEEVSEEDRKPRGRRREKTVVEEYDGPSRSLSPLDPRSYPRRAHSAAERQEQAPRKHMRPSRSRENEHRRQRSPSTEYTRVEIPSRHDDECEEVVYPKTVPIHFVDEVKYDRPVKVSRGYHKEHEEDIYHGKLPVRYIEGSVVYESPAGRSREPHREHEEEIHQRARPVQYVEVVYEKPAGSSTGSHHEHRRRGYARARDSMVDEVETFRRGLASLGSTIEGRTNSTRDHPHPEYASQGRDSYDSSRSSERRRRRRREPVPPTQTWQAPYPAEEDEVIVVTERREYRRPSREQPHDEAERRRQEYVDMTTLSARDQTRRFEREDAARYFQEDWERVDPGPEPRAMAKQRRAESNAGVREKQRKPSLAESYDYTISRGKNIPSTAGCNANNAVGCEIPVPRVPTPPPPTYTYDQARIPSPANSRAHSRERVERVYEDEASISSMSERERLAELGARHVTFRDTPSMKSAAAWSGSEKDPSPLRNERKTNKDRGGGGGWDGAEAGGGW